MEKIKTTNLFGKESSHLYINEGYLALYFRDIRDYKVLTPEREKELAVRMRSGKISEKDADDIKKEVYEGSLRFVVNVARQYQNMGIDIKDLISEGNSSLVIAMKRFDWRENMRFLSYAVWWIRQCIVHSINQHSRTVRLPYSKVKSLKAEREKFTIEGQTPEYLVTDLTFTDLDSSEIINVIADKNSPQPDHRILAKDGIELKRIMLSRIDNSRNLKIREKYILKKLLEDKEISTKELAEEFELSIESIRNIKKSAFFKFRIENKDLVNYL